MSSPPLAQAIVDRLGDRDDLDPWDLFNRANAFLELQRFKEAIADYDRLLELDPAYETGTVWRSRGHALQVLGQQQEAAESFLRAIEHGSDESGPYLDAAGAYIELREFERALTVLNDYLATDPDPGYFDADPGEAWLQKAAVLDELGRTEEADAAFEAAFQAEPEKRLSYRIRRGDHLAYQRRDFGAALIDFECCAAEDPEHAPWYRIRIALMQAALGRLKRAQEAYRQATEAEPATGEYIVGYANAMALGDVLMELLRTA